MAKKLFKRWLPDPKKIQNQKYLKVFGKFLYSHPNLWVLNRYSVATAFSLGLFITYLPFPGHMLLAAFLAIVLRANLPISLAMVWVVNPLTMIPLFGFAFAVGAYLLGIPLDSLDLHSLAVWKSMWQPLTVGCVVCGAFLAVAGNLFVRLLWRYSVAKSWQARQQRRYAVVETLTPQSEAD